MLGIAGQRCAQKHSGSAGLAAFTKPLRLNKGIAQPLLLERRADAEQLIGRYVEQAGQRREQRDIRDSAPSGLPPAAKY